LTPQNCGLNSAFSQQGHIVLNSSGSASSPIPLPTASTFPELLNFNVLDEFEAATQTSPTLTQPSFAPAATEDQLSSTAPQFVAGDAILDAILVFFTSSSSPSTTAGKNQSTSSTNSTQTKSVLSSISSNSARTTTINTKNTAEALIQTENNPVSTESAAEMLALMDRRRTSGTTGNRCHVLSCSSEQSSTQFVWKYKAHTSGNAKISEIQFESAPITSKHVSHQSRHDTNTVYAGKSKTDDGKTTTYTSTVTRLVTITIPASGVGNTSSSRGLFQWVE
jgi:hypothetical protein